MFGIFDAIKGFFEFVIGIFRFFLKLLQDLVYTVRMIGKAAGILPDLLQFLPTVLISLFMVTVSVIIIYKILGRD